MTKTSVRNSPVSILLCPSYSPKPRLNPKTIGDFAGTSAPKEMIHRDPNKMMCCEGRCQMITLNDSKRDERKGKMS